jgi:hypothetical protein
MPTENKAINVVAIKIGVKLELVTRASTGFNGVTRGMGIKAV